METSLWRDAPKMPRIWNTTRTFEFWINETLFFISLYLHVSQNLLWDWRCATTFKTYLAEEWERRYTLLVLQGWCCVTETLAWPSTGNNIPRRLHTEAFYRWCPGHTDHTCRQSYLVYTDISQCRGHTEGTRIPRDYSHKLREKGKLRKTVRNEEHFEQRAQQSELKANEWKT